MSAKQSPPAIWKKRILVPFWIVRILLMISVIIGFAYTIHQMNNIGNTAGIKLSDTPVVIFMLFVIIVLLIDILAIVLFLRDALHPGTFLTMNCFQTSFWTTSLILNLTAVGANRSYATIGISVVVFLSFVGLLIYSIISWRRFKKAAQRGQYAPTLNPAASSLLPQNQTANPYQQNTAYNPPTGGQIELQNTYQPAHQGGAAAGYYNEPNKPAYGA